MRQLAKSELHENASPRKNQARINWRPLHRVFKRFCGTWRGASDSGVKEGANQERGGNSEMEKWVMATLENPEKTVRPSKKEWKCKVEGKTSRTVRCETTKFREFYLSVFSHHSSLHASTESHFFMHSWQSDWRSLKYLTWWCNDAESGQAGSRLDPNNSALFRWSFPVQVPSVL